MEYQAVGVMEARKSFPDHRTSEETVPATQKKVSLLQREIRDKMTPLRVGERRTSAPEWLQKLNELPVGFRKGQMPQ